MLTSLGRITIRRVGGGATKSWGAPVYQGIWRSLRVDSTNNAGNSLLQPQATCSAQRSFATTTTATQTARPKTAKPKTKPTTTRAKTATKKKPVKKPAKKAAKKKTAAKKTSSPRRRAKKPLTDEQKLKAEEKKKKVELKQLKIAALEVPKQPAMSAWNVVLQTFFSKGQTKSLADSAKEAAAKYKSLSPSDLEEYNHIANQNRATYEATYKQWVESHTPDEIRIANNARNQLQKKLVLKNKYPPIVDPRLPKKNRSGHIFFAEERWKSGDFKGIKVPEVAALIAKEWAQLSVSEKKTHTDRAESDKLRYAQEYKTVFNRDPKFRQEAKAA